MLVIVAVVGTVRNIFVLDDLSDARVELTDRLSPAAIAAGDLTAAMLDQETGVRGYALSGDERFLEPYGPGRRNADVAMRQAERHRR